MTPSSVPSSMARMVNTGSRNSIQFRVPLPSIREEDEEQDTFADCAAEALEELKMIAEQEGVPFFLRLSQFVYNDTELISEEDIKTFLFILYLETEDSIDEKTKLLHEVYGELRDNYEGYEPTIVCLKRFFKGPAFEILEDLFYQTILMAYT